MIVISFFYDKHIVCQRKKPDIYSQGQILTSNKMSNRALTVSPEKLTEPIKKIGVRSIGLTWHALWYIQPPIAGNAGIKLNRQFSRTMNHFCHQHL